MAGGLEFFDAVAVQVHHPAVAARVYGDGARNVEFSVAGAGQPELELVVPVAENTWTFCWSTSEAKMLSLRILRGEGFIA